MLFPKKVKYRKWQTGRWNMKHPRLSTRGTTVAFGSHALKAVTHSRLKSNQIESARRVIVRSLGKTGKVWIRVFPDRPFTKKPPEVKLGKGKGDPVGYEIEVFPGRILFEIDGLGDSLAELTLTKAAKKLPLKARVIARK